MRVLMLAPFGRGLGQGGSQRATGIAERLEQRGAEIGWQVVARRPAGRTRKLAGMLAGRPALAELYGPPEPVSADWDAVIVAHSYLLPAVRGAIGARPAIVDFHNLEWQHLADGHGHGPGPGHGGPGAGAAHAPRRAYGAAQVALMRRLERAIVAGGALSLFTSEAELHWARRHAPGAPTLLVPSVLPLADERAAAAIRAGRDPQPGHLAYVGTLSFPPNLAALQRFLARDWPAMRGAAPGLRLTVAGRCAPAVRAALERHPGVQALGFVEDLTELLSRCQAVVMPFEGAAGTSLRALFYAVAGLPVIGSPRAFRGVTFPVGTVAADPAGWARAVTAGAPPALPAAAGESPALAHQRDPAPWDRLAAAIAELADAPRSPATAPPAPLRVGA